MNLAITLGCNRRCAFCFAWREKEAASMSRERFEAALDLLVANGQRQVRLLGGEPTNHPDFVWMLDRTEERGLEAIVFTGGLLSHSLCDALLDRADRPMLLMINTAYPFSGAEALMQRRTLAALGGLCAAGLTIDRPAPALDFLLDLQAEFGLRPLIRLGLAHPALGRENRFLHPKHYRNVGRLVARFAGLAESREVGLEFDCGWTPCMFPDALPPGLASWRAALGQRCGPVLDLLPDGNLVSCFALGDDPRARGPLASPLADLRAAFAQRFATERTATVFPYCDECTWRWDHGCVGGCLAMALRMRRPFGIGHPFHAANRPPTTAAAMGDARYFESSVLTLETSTDGYA